MILEACVETLEQAILAEKRGAHQLELCAHLELGGLSPSYDLVQSVLSEVHIPVKIMLRPRAGNFVYTNEEIKSMHEEIMLYEESLIDGFVFGCLTNECNPDVLLTHQLCSLIKDKSKTFHKAIDVCPDILEALKSIEQTGIDYVLSSGGGLTAKEGAATLKKMEAQSSHLKIIGAGKITDENLGELDNLIGLEYYHGRKIVGHLM